jgi:hypothetical protein
MRLEGFGQLKISMTSLGIKPKPSGLGAKNGGWLCMVHWDGKKKKLW